MENTMTKVFFETKTLTFILPCAAVGGIETVLYAYLSLLQKKYRVKVCFLSRLSERQKNIMKTVGIKYIQGDFSQKRYKFWHPFYLQYKIRKIYRKIYKKFFLSKKINDFLADADIIIDFGNGKAYDYIKNFTQTKKILWIHGGMPYVNENKWDFSIYDKVVVLTDSLKIQITEKFPEYKNKFVQIYNPMDFANMLCNEYFVHVSRIAGDKDIKTLIDAYELFFAKTKSPTNLYIVGDGNKLKYYKKYANKKESAKQIVFLGNQENPYPYMRDAKAVILSSKSEGLPCVLIEGLAVSNGVVVSSDCPNGPREILMDGKCGCLFPVGDAKTLAEIMSQIDEGKITRKNFAEYIPQSLKRFNSENILKSFEQNVIGIKKAS